MPVKAKGAGRNADFFRNSNQLIIKPLIVRVSALKRVEMKTSIICFEIHDVSLDEGLTSK